MNNGNTFVDNLFQGAQVVLSLAPIPGIAACAIAMQEVYRLVQRIQFREKECNLLCSYAGHVLYVINNNYQPAETGAFEAAVRDLTRATEMIQLDIRKWNNYGKAHLYLKNGEILEALQTHRVNIDRCLGMLNLASTLSQHEWNVKFTEAQAQDRVVLEDIARKQDELDSNMKEMKEMMKKLSAMAEDQQLRQAPQQRQQLTRTQEEMFYLRNTRRDTAVLPMRDMDGEVTKIGSRPAHAGTLYDIWKGVLLGAYFVALKTFRGTNPRPKDMERINRQVDLWRSISHPNILKLYGICSFDIGPNPPIYFVSPWMKNRDAVTYLRSNPRADRLRLIYDVAKGLQYLHSVSILHGGLQASNVLVAFNGSAVLSDFSLSKSLLDGNTTFTQSNGPSASLRWMSPEAHNAETMTSQSDVYSWAMTALQILTGFIPFHKIKAMGQLVVSIAVKNIKPSREDYPSDFMSDRVWNLLSSCWEVPEKRPSIEIVMETIAIERLEKTGWSPNDDMNLMEEMDPDYPASF